MLDPISASCKFYCHSDPAKRERNLLFPVVSGFAVAGFQVGSRYFFCTPRLITLNLLGREFWRRGWDSNLRRLAGVRARSRNPGPAGTTDTG